MANGKSINITFRLNKNRDKAVIDWLESIEEGERSYALRQALRWYVRGQARGGVPDQPQAQNKNPGVEARVDKLGDGF